MNPVIPTNGVAERNNGVNIDWGWVRQQLLDKEKVPPAAINCADECLKKAESLVSPRMISVRKNMGRLGLPGSALGSHIKGAEAVRVFLVTIGGALEEQSRALMSKGDELRGYLFDCIGSIAVESMAEEAEKTLRREAAKKGLSVSMRFSPGYCGWPIEDQKKLDKLLDFSRAGVRLTENYMMVPLKSISAVVGIGPKGLFSGTKSPCAACDKKDCNYRRTVITPRRCYQSN